uniref:hypothetical protein n=1 Tax=Escherichia coli TaxID=562 RepID=UPI00301B7716
YALPWFMLLGDTTRANSTLLARSGLDTPLRSAPHAAGSMGQAGHLGSALYALPWFMLLGDTTRANSTLLARSGLDTPLRSAPHAAGSMGQAGHLGS